MDQSERTRRSRCGVQTLELIIALPVLVLATFAIFQFGMIMAFHHSVMSAATEGAREAAKGATPAEVGLDVETFLSVHGLTVAAGSGVMVVVEDSGGVSCVGDTVAPCPAVTSISDPNEVKVTVLVSYDATPAPNFLDNYGIDFSSSRYELCSIARKD